MQQEEKVGKELSSPSCMKCACGEAAGSLVPALVDEALAASGNLLPVSGGGVLGSESEPCAHCRPVEDPCGGTPGVRLHEGLKIQKRGNVPREESKYG